MAQRLRGQVVVIVGASSGIGRAAAEAFAREGADIVVAARRENALHGTAEAVHRAGGRGTASRAMVVSTDVRDPQQMRRLAERAIEGFGGIDIWINNAGAASFGRFDETPDDIFRGVVETSFFGVVNGFRAVLPHFKQRRRGTVITTASIVSLVPTPYQASYVAAKHAVLGFVETVRQELMLEGLADIHVCSILPGPVDTPFWQHSANVSGREVLAMQSLSTAEEVAQAMVRTALHPRREVGVGAPAWLLKLGMAVAQGPVERGIARMARQSLWGGTASHSDGAVMQPMPEGAGTDGGWRRRYGKPAEQRRQVQRARPAMPVAGVLALALPIGAAVLYRYGRQDRRA